MAQESLDQPVGPPERILALDVLRGFAILGVLLAYCMWSLGTAPGRFWSGFDKTVAAIVGFAVDGKFYTILAFLFGVGFSIQLRRASADAGAVTVYCRRLAVLAAIGLTHALLLRNGDVLLPYALTGFLLIPFRRRSTPFVLAAAVAALAIPIVTQFAWEATGAPLPERPRLENAPFLVENAAWASYWYSTALFTWPLNLTLFLFGFAAGRHELVARLAQSPKALASIAAAGLAAGTIFYAAQLDLLASSSSSLLARSLRDLTFTLHSWAMSAAYAALLIAALRSRIAAAALAPIAAMGRLALTNYLMQAAIIVPLCLTFGWFDNFTPTASLLLTLSVASIQLPFSLVWVRHFRFGPVEWIWRLMTYGRVPPIRLGGSGYARL